MPSRMSRCVQQAGASRSLRRLTSLTACLCRRSMNANRSDATRCVGSSRAWMTTSTTPLSTPHFCGPRSRCSTSAPPLRLPRQSTPELVVYPSGSCEKPWPCQSGGYFRRRSGSPGGGSSECSCRAGGRDRRASAERAGCTGASCWGGGHRGPGAVGPPAVPVRSAGSTRLGGITRPALPRATSLRLPVTAERPAWIWPAKGRVEPAGACHSRLLVVESCLQDHDVIAVDQVDKPVFLADPPGPGAGEHVAERFGFANSGGGVA